MNGLSSPVDIRPDHLEIVQDILREHLPMDVKVWVFGSRANWTTKDSSDLDLAVEGAARLDNKAMSALEMAFKESDLPYFVDAVDLNTVGDAFKQIVEEQRTPFPMDGDDMKGMGAGWWEVTLGDLGLVERGRSRRRPRNSPELYGGPYPFIQTGDIKASQGRITNHKQTYSEAGLAQSRIWPTGTMAITIAANIAETAILTYPACFPDSVIGFVADESKCDVRFIEYTFRLLRSKIQHENVGTGSVQDNINLQTLDRLRFLIPPIQEQQAIAHVLGTLDDKIELNRRMNETLEEMARALFKSWFVDFEPVRAKMEGRWRRGESLPGLPADLYDAFPERMAPSELGDIPEGWGVGVLDNAVVILSGGTPKTSVHEYWNGGIPWYTAKDAPSLSDIFVLTTERSISQAGVENSSTKVLPAGTTVITARGTVGRLACLGIPMAMNQTCYGLRGASGYPNYFTYWNVRNTVSDLQARTHGTIFDTITRQTFKIAETLLPPIALAKMFESDVRPVMGRILRNLEENRAIAAQRDALLPGLVGGEVTMKEDLYSCT